MADFQKAYDHTMQFEDARSSGVVSQEPGGAKARFGINSKAHPEMPEDFWIAPPEIAKAEAEKIEESGYWDPLRLSEVEHQDVANKLFDMAVNMGVHQAAVLAQRAANGLLQDVAPNRLAEDGIIGAKTLAAINSLDPARCLQALRDLSAQLYRHITSINPAQAGNLEGWLRRAEA